jgi:hypothetical protein
MFWHFFWNYQNYDKEYRQLRGTLDITWSGGNLACVAGV